MYNPYNWFNPFKMFTETNAPLEWTKEDVDKICKTQYDAGFKDGYNKRNEEIELLLKEKSL
jgi:hypothetical protein